MKKTIVCSVWILTIIGAYVAGSLGIDSHFARKTPQANDSEIGVKISRDSEADRHGARLSPALELATIYKLKDPFARATSFSELITPMDGQSLLSVLEGLAINPRSAKRDSLIKLVLVRLGMIAPEVGFRFAANYKEAERVKHESAIIEGWTNINPQAAWKWLSDNPRSSVWNSIRYDSVLQTLADSGEVGLFPQLLDSLGTSSAKTVVAAQMTQLWMENSPEAAMQWINTMPKGLIRQTALSNAAIQIARTDPEASVALANATDSPQIKSVALEHAVSSLMGNGDSSKAFSLITQNPPSPAADAAVAEFVRLNIRDNQENAARAMSAFSDATKKQLALERSTKMLVALTKPADAMSWVLSFSSPAEKEKLLTNVVQNWSKSDLTSARSFILQESRLTESEQHLLLSKLAR